MEIFYNGDCGRVAQKLQYYIFSTMIEVEESWDEDEGK